MQLKSLDKVHTTDVSKVPWSAPLILSLCIIPFGWAGFLAPLTWIALTSLEICRGWSRAALYFVCIALMLLAGFNIIPGSERIQILTPYSDSAGNLIYASFNSGKALVAIGLLAFMLRQKQTVRPIDLFFLIITIAIPIAIGLVLYGPSVKISNTILIAAVINLLVVCISEEGFFRWVLQRGLEESLAEWRWLSVPIVTVIFTMLHVGWSADTLAIILLGLASFCYAILWYLRRNFWLCVMAHWAVNVFHMLLLPYPLPA
ncbi:lysostaphin resistance A-like protein [Microbulbifer sp. JMSA008]|uniref:lysostaphin resistance A-like protein n=1 Tax=Microbulbifer sp. JMSA008 TaxID=3243373 RepID=UPI0040392003